MLQSPGGSLRLGPADDLNLIESEVGKRVYGGVYQTIEKHRDELAALCRRYHVRRLELFGSATRADFDESNSDIDFLVEFEPSEPAAFAHTYFGLLEALEALFERPVELVSIEPIRNPYFLERINRERTLLYAA